MAYYYVKAGGTANAGTDNGRSATQRTGTWNAATIDYYPTIAAANSALTKPIDGDFIMVSHLHVGTHSLVSVFFNSTGSVSGIGLVIVSVDNANQENYKPGASETITDAFSYYIYNNGLIAGVSLSTDNDTINILNPGTEWVIQDCTLTAQGSGDFCVRTGAAGSFLRLVNVELVVESTGAEYFLLAAGNVVIWDGGSVSGVSPGSLIDPFGTGGGAQIHITGVDFSSFTGALHEGMIAGANDATLMRLQNCRLNSSVTFPTLVGGMHRLEIYNTDWLAGGGYHRFHVETGIGTAKNNDATYVTDIAPWYEGSIKSSIEVTTKSRCSNIRPFVFELPAQYVDLSNTVSDVLSLDLLVDNTVVTLTDTDIAAFLVYPDGTTAIQANWISTGKTVGAGNIGTDPLAAGTTLTNTGGLGDADWTKSISDVNATQYRLLMDTSVDPGQATAVSIRIEIYKESINAGELFIHPIINTG